MPPPGHAGAVSIKRLPTAGHSTLPAASVFRVGDEVRGRRHPKLDIMSSAGSAPGEPHDAPLFQYIRQNELGADLQNETKLKIGWINACLSVLNPADSQVATNAGRVLSQLGERLTSAADALGDGPDSADLSLLMFKVKKLSS